MHHDGIDTLWPTVEAQSIEDVLRRAITACQQAGHDPNDHFRQATKMVTVGSGADRA